MGRWNVSFVRTWSQLASALIIVTGCLVLLGWVLDIAILKGILPGLATMKVNTAIAFVLTGVTIWLSHEDQADPRRRRSAQTCASVVFLIGLLTLGEYMFDWDFGIDQLLIRDTASDIDSANPGRMAHATAFGFVMLGAALWLLNISHRYFLVQLMTMIVIGMALLALAVYLYSVAALYGVFAFTTVALHTALAFLVCGVGILLARPRHGLMAVVSGEYLGSVLARRLLPAVILIPVLFGWLCLKGQQQGLYDTEFGLALFALSNIFTFSVLVWWNAYLLNRAEAKRQQAAEHIRKLNRILAVLSDINQAIVHVRQMPLLFEAACQIAVEKGGFRMAWLGLIDPSEQIRVAAHAGLSNGFLEKLHVELSDKVLAQDFLPDTLHSSDHVVYNDIRNAPQELVWRADVLQIGCRASAAFPLKVDGKLLGVFNLYVDEPDFFDDEELRLLDEMAGDISFAMEFAEQDEQRQQAALALQRYAQRMEILHEIDLGLIRGGSIHSLVEATLEHLRQIIPCQRADVTIMDETNGEALIFAVALDGDTSLGQGIRVPHSPNVLEGYDERHIRIFADIRSFQDTRPRARQLVNEGLVCALSALLMDRERVMGTLGLFADSPDYFTTEHEEIVAQVANQLAIAIRQIQLFEELAHHRDNLELLVEQRTEELSHTKDHVEAILNNSTDGILLAKTDLSIQQTNPAFDVLFAAESEAYFGRSLLSLLLIEDAAEVTQAVQRVIASQQGTLIEVRAQRQDRILFDAELSIGAITASEKVPDSLVCTIRDITERKKAEQALQTKLAEEQDFQNYLKELHEISIELTQIDQLDNFYKRAVELGLSHLGFERMGLLLYEAESGMALGTYGTDTQGMLVDEHHLRFDPAKPTGILKHSLERSERFAFEEETELFTNFERTAYGWNAAAVLWNGEQSLGWLTVDNGVQHKPSSKPLLDILALYALTIGALLGRKQAEVETREQHNFLQMVINNVPDLILVKDRAGRFQLVNELVAQLYDITPAEMQGKTDAEVNPNQAEVASHLQKDQETLQSGQPIFIPEENILGRYYQTSKIPLKNSAGQHSRLLVVASDITERKMAEELLLDSLEKEKELGELKSRFVSMASHEFRTPLATIQAATETLGAYRHRMEDEQVEQRLDKILEQVGHLKDIMDDVLQLARLQARRVEFNPAIFDLDSLCRSVLDEFQNRPEITCQIHYTCDPVLRKVKLDKKLMRQIISNLVSNAIKYSPDGKSIFVSLEYIDEALVLKVRDEGIGIPEADKKHLFEPFHRAENVGAISGTGLGLVIIKESVELHDGTITIESQVNVGTTFTISVHLGVVS